MGIIYSIVFTQLLGISGLGIGISLTAAFTMLGSYDQAAERKSHDRSAERKNRVHPAKRKKHGQLSEGGEQDAT